jgi:hypothetical protein
VPVQHNMKHFTLRSVLGAPVLAVVLFCLSGPNLARADAIYDFSLPANGSVSAFSLRLTFPTLLPAGGLLIFDLANSPEVTSVIFTTPGFSPAQSVVGLQITPTATLVGVSLRNAAFAPLLFTVNFPADFFVFPRTPLTTGTFSSTSGTVVSVLPLATGTPTGTLTVTQTTVPEPGTVLLFGFGLWWIVIYRRLALTRSAPNAAGGDGGHANFR